MIKIVICKETKSILYLLVGKIKDGFFIHISKLAVILIQNAGKN
jgi:hypothetical protein